MYGTIPDVVISKPPRNNQSRVVVALCVGVVIGALGTALLTPAPTPAPRAGQILAAMELDAVDGTNNNNNPKYPQQPHARLCSSNHKASRRTRTSWSPSVRREASRLSLFD